MTTNAKTDQIEAAVEDRSRAKHDLNGSTCFAFFQPYVLTEIDSALRLFEPVLRTRNQFLFVATLWALDCIKNDPKLAMRKLAATGATAQVVATEAPANLTTPVTDDSDGSTTRIDFTKLSDPQ